MKFQEAISGGDKAVFPRENDYQMLYRELFQNQLKSVIFEQDLKELTGVLSRRIGRAPMLASTSQASSVALITNWLDAYFNNPPLSNDPLQQGDKSRLDILSELRVKQAAADGSERDKPLTENSAARDIYASMRQFAGLAFERAVFQARNHAVSIG